MEDDSRVRWKDVLITDLFEVKNTHSIVKRKISPGTVPYVTASAENNSVQGYISYDFTQIDKGNCLVIGGKTFILSYQKDDFFSNDSHNLALYIKDRGHAMKNTYLFLSACIKKALGHKYYWGDSISQKKIQTDRIKIPIAESGKPDWNYMQRYIRVIEKKVIADAVKYKDRELNTAKQIVNKSENS